MRTMVLEQRERKSHKRKAAGEVVHPRPRLPRASEEMKRLAGLLEAEMLGWPNVTSRPMFGLNGIYRGPNIFAVLPRTRAMEVPDSIVFRLLKRSRSIMDQLANDQQIVPSTPEAKWISFVMQSDAEIHAALNWLALAYRQAVKS